MKSSSTDARALRGAAAAACALALCLAASGCRQDMHNQPRYKPLAESDFYPDGRASRTPPAGTVPRGGLRADRALYTGIGADGAFVREIPVPVARPLLERGRERFNIFCSPCHDQTGGGRGMIVQRGFKQPEPYSAERLRAQPIGYFYDVMTNGFGQMSSYAVQVPPEDRWAIAAWIRVLQVASHAPFQELPAPDREAVERAARGGPPAPAPGSEGHR